MQRMTPTHRFGLLTLQNHRCKNRPFHFAKLCEIKDQVFPQCLADCCYVIIAAVTDPSRKSKTSKSCFAPSSAVSSFSTFSFSPGWHNAGTMLHFPGTLVAQSKHMAQQLFQSNVRWTESQPLAQSNAHSKMSSQYEQALYLICFGEVLKTKPLCMLEQFKTNPLCDLFLFIYFKWTSFVMMLSQNKQANYFSSLSGLLAKLSLTCQTIIHWLMIKARYRMLPS